MNINSRYIAHKGIYDNNKIAENTLESFEKAIDSNYPFELDIRITKDNNLVVIHDDNLSRLSNVDMNIECNNYQSIKNIKLLNTNAYVPLLSDVLKMNNDKVYIIIEIKSTKKYKKLISILNKEIAKYKKIIIQSFDPRIIRYCKRYNPTIKCGLLLMKKYPKLRYNVILKRHIIIKYSLCDFLSISRGLFRDKKFIKHNSNKEIIIWTFDYKENKVLPDNYICICNNLPYCKK